LGEHYVRNVGVEGSNPFCSTIHSLGFRTSQRIARNPRLCAQFVIARGPGERRRRRESPESGKTYPGAIWLGPRIIAVDSPVWPNPPTGPLKRGCWGEPPYESAILLGKTGISLARPGVHSKALDLLSKYAITVFAMRLIVLGPILFILAGCFSTGTKLTPDQIASIRKGESYHDVIDNLGEPDRVQSGSDGRKMITYAYGEATLFSGVKTDVLLLMFDKDGILQNFQQSSSH
jgi:hypothetical protein